MTILERFLVTDHVAIVTGAGRGIGAATAVALAEAGADIVIASRTKADLDKVAEQIAATGRRAVVVAADLSDLDQVRGLVSVAEREFGRLDIVVNNVGGTMPLPYMMTEEDFLEEAFHFNVTTAHALLRAAVPLLLRSPQASVVNISSIMGRVVERGFLAYGTAKAAMLHFTALAARDLSPTIRVNAIAVGSVDTSALEFVVSDEATRTSMESRTPLGVIGEAEDIAATVLWLSSRAGKYVTGKTIEVDGGLEAPNLDFDLPDVTAADHPLGGEA